MTTVRELIQELSSLPEDAQVILASDEEGNSFHPIEEVGKYLTAEDEYGELDIAFEDDILEDNEGEIPDDFRPVVVLWP